MLLILDDVDRGDPADTIDPAGAPMILNVVDPAIRNAVAPMCDDNPVSDRRR